MDNLITLQAKSLYESFRKVWQQHPDNLMSYDKNDINYCEIVEHNYIQLDSNLTESGYLSEDDGQLSGVYFRGDTLVVGLDYSPYEINSNGEITFN